ncbi:MAG: single-stranded DNA-binding protein [Anaerolineales bacterium]|jgi:single-stranded DNA-binding protein
MARNNLVFVVGDITSDMYYDTFQLDGKAVPFLRMHLMVDGTDGASSVFGLRIVVYGTLAELTYGYVQKGSRIAVIGHIQRRTHEGENVFEVVANEVQFIKRIDWEEGDLVRKDLVQRGKLRPTHQDLETAAGGAKQGSAPQDGREP